MSHSTQRVDDDIMLVCDKDHGTKQKEYYTVVRTITVGKGQGIRTATAAIAQARGELPNIIKRLEEAEKAAIAANEKARAELEAQFGAAAKPQSITEPLAPESIQQVQDAVAAIDWADKHEDKEPA